MHTDLVDGEWWIVGMPDCPDCGPYETKAEADSDRIGMARFFRHHNKPDFMTTDRTEGKQ
jgi:predicted secreted protein